jgi:hypothetical protein
MNIIHFSDVLWLQKGMKCIFIERKKNLYTCIYGTRRLRWVMWPMSLLAKNKVNKELCLVIRSSCEFHQLLLRIKWTYHNNVLKKGRGLKGISYPLPRIDENLFIHCSIAVTSLNEGNSLLYTYCFQKLYNILPMLHVTIVDILLRRHEYFIRLNPPINRLCKQILIVIFKIVWPCSIS